MFNTINTKYEELKPSRLRDMFKYEKEHSAPNEMKVGTLNSYIVTSDKIYVEEGFNIRDLNEEHVKNFAQAYRDNKTIPQIIVKVVLNEDGEYICIVRDGHHRFAGGIEAGKTEFEVNEFQGDKIDEVLLMIDTANGLPLNQLDLANAVSRLKDEGLNNSEIGRKINKSSAHVGHLLDLLSMPERLKNMVRNDLISPTYARELFKEHGDNVMSVITSINKESNQNDNAHRVGSDSGNDKINYDDKVTEIMDFVEKVKVDNGTNRKLEPGYHEVQLDIDDAIDSKDLEFLHQIGHEIHNAGTDNADDEIQIDVLSEPADSEIVPAKRVTKLAIKGKSIPKSISTEVRDFILKLAAQLQDDDNLTVKLNDSDFFELMRFQDVLNK
ncbi:hypothetical protein GCM10011607_11680 [Shewanella inventionis]|uniref:ParB/Spo0J HTH domain-containing protein n=1 Tax=Shewanella inventionis TaxID=1738770 RepID=A0ABQ1IV31_9GAMM|nr:ParB/RepB/Spo0J family partition protein [Shewanella inventionis]GGB52839.1 hypothetical protein GCM10011607_11680 [Shewanella inventionis]